jgi:hypothetical protein
MAMTASTGKCGRWPDDLLATTSENKHYANFGCASQKQSGRPDLQSRRSHRTAWHDPDRCRTAFDRDRSLPDERCDSGQLMSRRNRNMLFEAGQR